MMTQFNMTKAGWVWGVTFENADSSSKVVDSSGSLKGSGDDSGRRDEIVGKGVVEVALKYDLSKSYDIYLELVEGVFTWSSKTSCTASNSFSNLQFFITRSAIGQVQSACITQQDEVMSLIGSPALFFLSFLERP
jgi:hypothetical protein